MTRIKSFDILRKKLQEGHDDRVLVLRTLTNNVRLDEDPRSDLGSQIHCWAEKRQIVAQKARDRLANMIGMLGIGIEGLEISLSEVVGG